MSEPRAIVFDLDDTLYPLRRFVQSGFAAVADVAACEVGVPRHQLVAILRDARRWAPGMELQCLCNHFGLPASDVNRFVNIVRALARTSSAARDRPRARRAAARLADRRADQRRADRSGGKWRLG